MALGRKMGLADSFAGVRYDCEEQSGKKAAWRESCRIIRHLGSGIQRAGSFAIRQSKTILARNWFSYYSRNMWLWLVVSDVEDYVPKLAFVHKLAAFWALKEVLFLCVA
jgi:hypothetical protein